ncbi:ATP-grasp domain-containing protein [Micromonospora matsumotoense]|uniref:ATP-grasp domain-containing protein n=1 Tax=Micromonospora matsumotoense TaxID=121616 RepID=UPI00340520B3
MACTKTVVHIGLRRPPLEWRAELAAGTELGYATHLVSDVDPAYTGLAPGGTTRFGAAEPPAELAGVLAAELRRLEPPAGVVVCWGDRNVEITARLAATLGLSGVGVAAALTCGDKAAQRKALEPYGVNPRWRAGTTLADLRAAVADLTTAAPLLFKLAHSSGGRGAAPVHDDTDLAEVFRATDKNYLPSTAFVVEEFVSGTEHSVAGLVHDGNPVPYAIADKTVGDDLKAHCTVVPSALDPVMAEQVRAAACEAVRAVGLESGGFHVDLRLTDTGPVVLEVGARLGGDLINSHLVPIATGGRLVPYRSLVDLLATGAAPGPAPYTRGAAMVVLPAADRAVGELVDRASAHPAAHAAADWSTPQEPAVAVVVTTDDPRDAPAAVSDLRRWVGPG